MKRTTILVDDALLIEARSLAQQRAMTFTALVNEALRAYVQTHRTPRHLSCIGVGRSERPTHSLHDGGDEDVAAYSIPLTGQLTLSCRPATMR